MMHSQANIEVNYTLKIQMHNLTFLFIATTLVITRLLIHSYTLWHFGDPEIIISRHVHPM